MRLGAPIFWLVLAAALIAASPAVRGESEHKTGAQEKDAHAKDAHGKKDKHEAKADGKEEAPAPPAPPRRACFYDPDAPMKPLAVAVPEHQPADGQAGAPKTDASTPPATDKGEHPPAAETNGAAPAAVAAPAAPDPPAGDAKTGHPAASAGAGGAPPPSGEAAPGPPTTVAPAAAPDAAAKTETPATGPAAVKNEAEQPATLIRMLELIQDKIGSGSRDAYSYRRELILDIAKKLPHATDADWRQPRNSRAAIIFVLSGGDPNVLAKLLTLSPVPCLDDDLIKGVLEYSQGQQSESVGAAVQNRRPIARPAPRRAPGSRSSHPGRG